MGGAGNDFVDPFDRALGLPTWWGFSTVSFAVPYLNASYFCPRRLVFEALPLPVALAFLLERRGDWVTPRAFCQTTKTTMRSSPSPFVYKGSDHLLRRRGATEPVRDLAVPSSSRRNGSNRRAIADSTCLLTRRSSEFLIRLDLSQVGAILSVLRKTI